MPVEPHWHKPQCRALSQPPTASFRFFPRTALRLAGSFDPTELAVFVCDFSRLLNYELTWRSCLNAHCHCAVTLAARRRPLCGSTEGCEDRRSLRVAMYASWEYGS